MEPTTTTPDRPPATSPPGIDLADGRVEVGGAVYEVTSRYTVAEHRLAAVVPDRYHASGRRLLSDTAVPLYPYDCWATRAGAEAELRRQAAAAVQAHGESLAAARAALDALGGGEPPPAAPPVPTAADEADGG